FFADEIVAAVEVHHYPLAAADARPLPFTKDLTNSARGLVRALVFNALAIPVAAVLFFTIIGAPIVFLAVNALLLGRELTDMAWLRHCGDANEANPVSKVERFVLGGTIAALMLVPFVNLIAPIVGAAAGTHLAHGAMGSGRERDRERGNA
ncbi:MAG: EI24 domain-containing protein, partial [Pseudomonadota bacterium]